MDSGAHSGQVTRARSSGEVPCPASRATDTVHPDTDRASASGVISSGDPENPCSSNTPHPAAFTPDAMVQSSQSFSARRGGFPPQRGRERIGTRAKPRVPVLLANPSLWSRILPRLSRRSWRAFSGRRGRRSGPRLPRSSSGGCHPAPQTNSPAAGQRCRPVGPSGGVR